jgi:hypothetical protein
MRGASEEQKSRFGEAGRQWVEKCKASGVRHVGEWHAYGPNELDGFGHYVIFEVADLSTALEMSTEISDGEMGRLIERFSFSIGFGTPEREAIWKS